MNVLKRESHSLILTHDLVSVTCSAGHYKSAGITTCQTCAAGKEPSGDKITRGKRDLQTKIMSIICYL